MDYLNVYSALMVQNGVQISFLFNLALQMLIDIKPDNFITPFLHSLTQKAISMKCSK